MRLREEKVTKNAKPNYEVTVPTIHYVRSRHGGYYRVGHCYLLLLTLFYVSCHLVYNN